MKNFSREEIKTNEREYFISAIEKSNLNENRIKEINIKHVCVEKDIYTLNGETEAERQFLENMYCELYEKGYDALYNILTDDTKDTVTAQERYAIIGFVVSMLFRNNSWVNFHNKVTDDMIARGYNLTKENGKDHFFFEDREISIVGKSFEKLQREMKKQTRPMIALATVEHIFELIRLRVINDVVTIIKARDGFEFITSDNPVTFKGKVVGRMPISLDPTNSLSIPVDKNHILKLESWGHELDWNLLGRLDDGPFPGILTSMNNHFQLQQSGRFLLGTDTGLKKFKDKPNGIFPGDKIG
jgi:hypothetical protein